MLTFWSILVLFLLTLFPFMRIGGFAYLIQTYELAIWLGLAMVILRGKFSISMLFDQFPLALLTLVVIGLIVVGARAETIQDFNLVRWQLIFPLVFYLYFRAVSRDEFAARAIVVSVGVFLFSVLVLNIYLAMSPDLEVVLYYRQETGFVVDPEGFVGSAAFRLYGIFSNPIFLAVHSLVAVTLGASLTLCTKKLLERFLGVANVALGLTNIYLSYSRGPILIAVLSVWVLALSLKSASSRRSRSLTVVAAALCSLVGIFLLPRLLAYREVPIGLDERVDAWHFAVNQIFTDVDSFFLGTSPDLFYEKFGYFHAHQHFLSTALFLGFPYAIIFYAAIITKWAALLSGTRRYRIDPTSQGLYHLVCRYSCLVLGLSLFLQGLWEASCLDYPRINLLFYMLLGVASSRPHLAERFDGRILRALT